MPAVLLLLVIVLVMAAGIITAWRGWRGAPVLSLPRCAKCGYDLRGADPETTSACAECGADLTRPHAVHFGRYERRPKLIVLGIVIALLPVVLMIVGRTLAYRFNTSGPVGVARRSSERLIADFAADLNSPWVPQELARRYRTGELTADEITSLMAATTDALAARPPDASPFVWSSQLIALLLNDPSVTDQQRRRLYEAHYFRPLQVTMRKRIRQGSNAVFEIEPASSSQLPGLQQIYALRRLTFDESQAFPLTSRHRTAQSPFSINGSFKADMPTGEHSLTFEVESGLLQDDPTGANSVSSGSHRLPRLRWPEAVLRWTETVTIDVDVLPEDQSPIEMIHDDSLTPRICRGIVPHAVLVENDRGDLRMTLDLTKPREPPAPLSFDVFVICSGREYRLGHFFIADSISGSSDLSRRLAKPLPESVREAVVVLRPSPRRVEDTPQITRIWDHTLEYEAVPVKRFDLAPP